MANFPSLLAMVLPILVAALHISSRTTSTDRQLTVSSSPRHQPPDTGAVSSGMVATEAVPGQRSVPFQPDAAVLEEVKNTGLVAVDMVDKMKHLAKVLRLFGYKSMASAVPLMADSWILKILNGPTPITVFAVPDASFEAACIGGSLRPLVLKQTALGSYPFFKLSLHPSLKLRSGALGVCLTSLTTIFRSSSIGNLTRTKVVSINSVEITHPDLYSDGHFVVHGVKSYIHLPPYNTCTRSNDPSV